MSKGGRARCGIICDNRVNFFDPRGSFNTGERVRLCRWTNSDLLRGRIVDKSVDNCRADCPYLLFISTRAYLW